MPVIERRHIMNQAYLFNNGQNYQSYLMLGSRPDSNAEGESGYRFAVWAPRARSVSVVGDFNDWESGIHNLRSYGTTGIWTGFIADLKQWDRYKYAIEAADGNIVLKADPFARHSETRPGTASILYDSDDYEWNDDEWMANRTRATDAQPLNIYEVHLGSWRRYEDGNVLNYRELGVQLADYLNDMGYNAVEIMPVADYPLDDSWGYQVTGYFSVTSRYGTPADFKYMIDYLHQHNIRVILDWVPAHFPRDEFGLRHFDGEPLYEYADTRLGEHAEWGTLVFDYSKSEVRSFLFSNAWFWVEEFHVDGLRVDAVSSMIYLDYGRHDSVTNVDVGNANYEAIDFLQAVNKLIRTNFPGVMMIAEESTSWPYVTGDYNDEGLGFTHKWNMGWMNDTLKYMSLDYIYRRYHHNQLTFSMMYAFSENFILPFSHDEVVHGKCSLIGRMPGDYWRQFASLRALFAYQMAHPGAKLNFMGNEFAPFIEWRFYEELQWFMLTYDKHRQMKAYVRKLNHYYLKHPAFWEVDDSWDGFRWLQADDSDNSVLAFARFSRDAEQIVVIILNLTPAVHPIYALPAPKYGKYRVVLNSDDDKHGGSSYLGVETEGNVYTTTFATEQAAKEDLAERRAEVDAELNAEIAARLRAANLTELWAKKERGEKLKLTPKEKARLQKMKTELASVRKTFRGKHPEPQQVEPTLELSLPPLAAMYLEYESE